MSRWSRQLLSLPAVCNEGDYTRLAFRSARNGRFACVLCARRKGGVLVALPDWAFGEEELQEMKAKKFSGIYGQYLSESAPLFPFPECGDPEAEDDDAPRQDILPIDFAAGAFGRLAEYSDADFEDVDFAEDESEDDE